MGYVMYLIRQSAIEYLQSVKFKKGDRNKQCLHRYLFILFVPIPTKQ